MRGYVIGLILAFVCTATLGEALHAQGSAPRIVALSPTSASAGSVAITLTVNGEHFDNAGQGAVVRWNGVNRNTTYVSETQCPTGTAPIGMYVYQNAAGRASGLSFLCVRPDN
jgi:hypothetical protein